MKYNIDTQSNSGFIQIFGITEWGKNMEYPFAFQIRGGHSTLDNMIQALETTLERIKTIDRDFHSNPSAKTDFEQGFTIFIQGEVPITIMCKMRMISMMVGWKSVGDDTLRDPQNLLKALKKTKKKAESEK